MALCCSNTLAVFGAVDSCWHDSCDVFQRGQAHAAAAIACTHLGNLESNTVLLAQLLKLSLDAVGDAGRALGIETVQHAFHKVNLHTQAPAAAGCEC